VKDTKGKDYADRLRDKQQKRWKKILRVQAPYQWNMRRQQLGRTLDVGWGIGRNMGSLSPDSVGVDHNADAVAEARESGFTALTTEEWQTSELRREGAFDGILLAHVIEHMDEADAIALMEDYLPYLRPGGKVFFVCPQERGYDSDPTHVRFADFRALADLCSKVGLTVQKSFSFPFPRFMGKPFIYNEFCVLAVKAR
jgi:2-polyprenyl-3-methyl-5-hydroxy-6-metoxy-1,4-benzoquinol methylase